MVNFNEGYWIEECIEQYSCGKAKHACWRACLLNECSFHYSALLGMEGLFIYIHLVNLSPGKS